MSREKILIIEDEEDILELVSYNLTKEEFTVAGVATGEEALDKVRSDSPDLVVLDLMLPGIDGLEVCKRIKSNPETEQIPVVMLTAKGEEADVVAGLELGADDYVTKPFSPKVLIARIRAVLRRKTREVADETSIIQIQDILIHPGRNEVQVRGEPIDLTFTEFQILHCLARRPGWVFSRDQIVDAVRGEDYAVTTRSVDVHIVALRKKLGPARDCIETVRGIGYRFRD